MELTFATLMARAGDEPDAMYGFAARAVKISDDGLTYRFLMRSEATFHDGSRLTAHDVAFSLNLLKQKGHPIITQQLRDLTSIDADDDRSVTLRFAEKRARDVPLFAAAMPIFSRAYYSSQAVRGIDPRHSARLRRLQGRPLRAGPLHRIRPREGLVGEGPAGHARAVQFRHRALRILPRPRRRLRRLHRQELPVPRGIHLAHLGDALRLSRRIKDGRVKQEILPDDTPSGAQGWFINTRREKFKNPKMREALILAFDFEWTNKTIMYGSYDRTHSVFQNSDLMAKGPPSPDEVALLEPFRGKVPAEVFGEPFVPPVSDGSGQDRALLRRAGQLLNEAGYPIKDGKRVGPKGERLTIEFLLEEPSFQPHHMPYIKNLQNARHRRQPAADRCRADAEPAQRLRLRPDDPALLVSSTPGEFAAHLSFPRRPPRSRDRRTSPASPIR